MTCAKKLGKSNEEFIVIWYDSRCYSHFGFETSNDDIKNDATYFAAENGHLECLKYCTENGYKKHDSATLWAARNGHLECLKYCTENGYKKHDEATC